MVDLEPNVGDQKRLRQAYGCFPSGVTAVCALDGSEPVGMAASSFTSVSIHPGLVSVCIQNSSTTWPLLRELSRLGVSVLAEHHNQACRALSQKTGDRFAAVEWSATASGAVFINEAAAALECAVHREVEAGDHTIVLLAVHALHVADDREPLIFHGSRFRQLAKA
ncbi:flavin reductase family protein [Nocardia sp. CA2R105]|uniref:flavin reductase family protein n=1 Tax=Nocardia coffeae TaxID=2873381 RepID=UPI001CA748D3|nr:flavin reductase family protein [Nocardia coffeae]MBY8860390.1 flavin reductase family protein [Nocardia coffeae]